MEVLLIFFLTLIGLSVLLPPLLFQSSLMGSSLTWIEKLLFIVVAFQASAVAAWLTFLRKEVTSKQKEKSD